MAEIRVRVWRVGRRSESQYLLILRDDWGNPLVMVIGPCEAVAIWAALRAGRVEHIGRIPATHDLIDAMVTRLGGKLQKVVIDDLWNGVYYAKLHVAVDGQHVTVDGRPSDAVALALRSHAPVYVTEEVMAASREAEPPSEEPQTGPDPLGGLEDL